MSWLARLKNIDTSTETQATKPPKPGYVGFVAPIPAPIQKNEGQEGAANDPAPDPDRWCWPNSQAMNTSEIDAFTGRVARFSERGLGMDEVEALADRLVIRDREGDDRRVCLECDHLRSAGRWRCGNGQSAGIALSIGDAPLGGDLVCMLQRCDGFSKKHFT